MRRGRRRGRRGDGTITPVKGGFLARYSTTEGGVRKRQAKTFTLRNEAEWWLSQAKRHGEAPDDPLLRDYLHEWLRSRRKAGEATRTEYREHIDLHIVPVLAGYRLHELRQRHVEAFVADLERKVSPKTKRPLAPTTVGYILATLRRALDAAVPTRIPDNPARGVEAPPVPKRQVEAMTPADARALIEAVRGTWMALPVRVLLGSGLRIGEAVALDQGDVHDGWVGLRESKTTIRAVRLSADADSAIHEAIRTAPRRGKREPVFYGPRTGDRLRGDSLTHALPRELERAGLGRLTPHGLRHGTATLMVAAGVHMRVVAEQLGHANPAMTAKVYSHVAPQSIAEAVSVLDDAVSER